MIKHFVTITCDPIKLSDELNLIVPLCSDVKIINVALAANQLGLPVLVSTVEIIFSTEIQKDHFISKDKKSILKAS